MTATLDRAVFFDRVRKPLFGGSLTAEQVQGMDAIFGTYYGRGLSEKH